MILLPFLLVSCTQMFLKNDTNTPALFNLMQPCDTKCDTGKFEFGISELNKRTVHLTAERIISESGQRKDASTVWV